MPIKPDPTAVSELQAHCHDRAVVELPNATSSKSMSQRMRALLCLGIFATNLITGGVNSAMGESYHSETEALTGQENAAETLSEKQAKYEGYDLNFNTIKTLARINIHEVMHCLDDLVYNDEGYEQGWIVDAVRYGR